MTAFKLLIDITHAEQTTADFVSARIAAKICDSPMCDPNATGEFVVWESNPNDLSGSSLICETNYAQRFMKELLERCFPKVVARVVQEHNISNIHIEWEMLELVSVGVYTD